MSEETETKVEESDILADLRTSLKYLDNVADRVVGLIGGMKEKATEGKALITSAVYMSADEKTELKDKYVNRLLTIKTTINDALNA